VTSPDPTDTLAALDFPTPCYRGCGRPATWAVTLTHQPEWQPCTTWGYCAVCRLIEEERTVNARLAGKNITCRPHGHVVTVAWARIGDET
jgi:hypothetical protein